MAFLKPDKVETWNGVTINQYCLNHSGHNPNKINLPSMKLPNGKPKYITIHNTDWINTASGTTPAEQYLRAERNGNLNTVVVHFFVDNICAWQGLDLDLISYHSADGTSDPECGNRTSISIECIMRNSIDEQSLKSEDNAARLCAYLLNKYGLTINELRTHNYWTSRQRGIKGTIDEMCTAKGGYKWCPAYILPHWQSFKSKVQSYLGAAAKPITGTTATTTTTATPQVYRIRKTWDVAKSQIGAYASLDNAKNAWKEGYIVFDPNGVQVYPELAPPPMPAQPTEAESSQLYRIRKSWDDAKSQIGAFKNIENAKQAWKEGYFIYDESGKVVYPVETTVSTSDKPHIFYQVFCGNKWYPVVTDLEDYAGVIGKPIQCVAAISDKGTLKYRVHTRNRDWLPFVSTGNINDYKNGYAGIKGTDIDAVEFKLEGVENYYVHYRVSQLGKSYSSWTVQGSGAGGYNIQLDRIQVEAVQGTPPTQVTQQQPQEESQNSSKGYYLVDPIE